MSPDKPRPPLLGESPRELSFGSLSRQGWFDQQSTGSSRGWDRIPGSEGGQTRAFLDGDQAGDESVRNAPLARAAGLRFYYQRQRVRKHSTKKQTVNQNNSTLSSPTKTKPQSLRHYRTGRRERRKAEGAEAAPLTPSPGAGECAAVGSAEGEGALWVRSPRARSASSSRPLSLRRLGNPPRTPPPCWVRISDSD